MMGDHRGERAGGSAVGSAVGSVGRRVGRRVSGWAADRGAVTAEFAVALPAVVLVLAAVLLVVMAGTAQLRVADAARAGARAAAAGETDGRVAEIARHVGGEGVIVSVLRSDPWVTVQVRAPVAGGWFASGLTTSGEATAWLESAITDLPGGSG